MVLIGTLRLYEGVRRFVGRGTLTAVFILYPESFFVLVFQKRFDEENSRVSWDY